MVGWLVGWFGWLVWLVWLVSIVWFALPCQALSCLALPSLAFHLPCLALPCPVLPCIALPCDALPCLALPCIASPCLAFWMPLEAYVGLGLPTFSMPRLGCISGSTLVVFGGLSWLPLGAFWSLCWPLVTLPSPTSSYLRNLTQESHRRATRGRLRVKVGAKATH